MTVPEDIRQARESQRAELLRLGLRPVLVPRDQAVRHPYHSLEDMRQCLIRAGENPDFVEVWENA